MFELELVFKDLHPVIFVPRPGWDEELERSKTDIQCIIRGQWRIKVGDKSLLRELYITLRNDGDEWMIIAIRSAPAEQ